MTVDPSAPAPSARAFAEALTTYTEAARESVEASAALAEAQRAETEEIATLAVPELMRAPNVIVTDTDSLARVEHVLKMTVIGPHAEAEIARRLGEVRAYREQVEEIRRRHRVARLGETALDTMSRAVAALERLLQTPAPTFSALTDKIEAMATAPWRGSSLGVQGHLDALLADARRLRLAALPERALAGEA